MKEGSLYSRLLEGHRVETGEDVASMTGSDIRELPKRSDLKIMPAEHDPYPDLTRLTPEEIARRAIASEEFLRMPAQVFLNDRS